MTATPAITLARAAAAGALLVLAAPAAARHGARGPAPVRGAGIASDGRLEDTAGLQLHAESVHNCNNVVLHVTNFGLLGSLPGSHAPFDGAASAVWPSGSHCEYLYGAGLWVGGLANGTQRVTTAYPEDQFVGEFRPGRTALHRMYTMQDGARGGLRLPSPEADDDLDGRLDEDPLNGIDDDHDGSIDEDFAAMSDQGFTCEYRDTDPGIRAVYADHLSLDLRVRQSTLCWGIPDFDDAIGIEYTIAHDGPWALDDVYVGFYADFDVGPRHRTRTAEDDVAGFYQAYRHSPDSPNGGPRWKISLAYVFDADTDEGQSEGYVGLLFLGAQDPHRDGVPRFMSVANARVFTGLGAFDQGGDPHSDAERYRCLDGTAPRSVGPLDPDTNVRPSYRLGHQDDYSVLLSTGPFPHLEPGDSIGFQVAIVLGRGFDELLDNATRLQIAFGTPYNCDGDGETGSSGRESSWCAPQVGRHLYNECDTECEFFCSEVIPDSGCIWVNQDCEEEIRTGISTGQGGRECILRWVVSSAPPSPHVRVVASERRIDVLWDDASERALDVVLGVPDFESYRVWRAQGWTRPPGSDVRTGPPGDRWQMLGDFDVVNGVGNDVGLEGIRYRPNVPEAVLEYYRRWLEMHPDLPPPDLAGVTSAQRDTALALLRGVRYYRYVDPPFLPETILGSACPLQQDCDPLPGPQGLQPARCNSDGRCQATIDPPLAGEHLFYSVSATDHTMVRMGRDWRATGPGVEGSPASNAVYVVPRTRPLEPERWSDAERAIYVVPNPVTRASLAPWRLDPTNDDPTGVKVEFHHLPATTGSVTLFTLAGDRVARLAFDGRNGDGTLAWDLLNRNGQEVTSGVYIWVVEADDPRFPRTLGKFVVIR